ncbi:MAG: hypothetical protein RID53_01000 [Coleofasciculus sp. B1-GNL1-01]|uniref:hypothetical protein n=1 Tax=Coleofasciculus sp. B1-GNL1-01 TaxID=3068484 RepID=UPI0033006D3E
MDFLELDPGHINIILQYKIKLEKLGVKLDDEHLKEAIYNYAHNLEPSIQAFMEYCAKGQLEQPNEFLIKALRYNWKPRNISNPPDLPVFTAADFDTGQTPEQRQENYRRLCDLVKRSCHPSKPSPRFKSLRRLRLYGQRPDPTTIAQFMADPILRPEIERAISQHPEWGYEITPNGVQELEF